MTTVRFVLLCVLYPVLSFGQSDAAGYFKNIKPRYIKLQKNGADNVSLNNINKLRVIDARYDTSCLGFVKGEIGNNFFSVRANAGVANEVEGYVKSLITEDKAGAASILIAIKRLWISEDMELGEINTVKKWAGQEKSGVYCTFECYLCIDDAYYPLLLYDSSFTSDRRVAYTGADNLLRYALNRFVSKLTTMDLTKVPASRRKLTFDDITDHLAIVQPVKFSSGEKPRKGIYKTFDEFKQNTPSISEFEIKTTRTEDIIYVKEKDNSYLLRDLWGLCDGENIFIYSAGKRFELVRNGNTYFFVGARDVSRRRRINAGGAVASILLPGIVPGGTAIKTVYAPGQKPYQVDMETGEVY